MAAVPRTSATISASRTIGSVTLEFGTIALSNSYATGGDSLSNVFPANGTITVIFHERAAQANSIFYDRNSHKAVAIVKASGAEVADTTDLSGTTWDFTAIIFQS